MSEMLMTMVMMSIKNLRPGVWVRCTEATFVMVARDPLNKTASFVNPLKLVTSDEKEVFQRGIENKKRYFFPLLLTCCKCFSIIRYQQNYGESKQNYSYTNGLFARYTQLGWWGTFSQTQYINVHLSRRISMNADSLFKVTRLSMLTIFVCFHIWTKCHTM